MKKNILKLLSSSIAVCLLFLAWKLVPAQNTRTEYVNENSKKAIFSEIKGTDDGVDEYGKDILGVGVNIGNTLDSYSGHELESTLDYETYWGNPPITLEFVSLIADTGFSTVRLPVTWDQHLLDDGITIDPVWMARVKEIVDYCFENDLYVILDAHHDRWYETNTDNYETGIYMTQMIWNQIAESFIEYDDHLIFEGFNEPCDDSVAGTDAYSEQSFTILNAYNEEFVNTVRATGGNNTSRLLLIASYHNSCNIEILNEVQRFTDKNIALSVHIYTPYKFTGLGDYDEDSTDYWSSSDTASVHTLASNLEAIQEFKKKTGIQVIVTEMGAINKGNDSSRIEWINYVTDKLNELNIAYIWWDDMYSDDNKETYALFDRNTNNIVNREITDVVLGR